MGSTVVPLVAPATSTSTTVEKSELEVSFFTNGHDQRSVTARCTMPYDQALKVRRKLERSHLIRGVVVNQGVEGECSLVIYGKWHLPWREHLVAKISRAIRSRLEADEVVAVVHRPLPGQSDRRTGKKERHFYAPVAMNYTEAQMLTTTSRPLF